MNKTTPANRPMLLQGTKNTRDLGGYPTADGINTVNGAFLRSDKPLFSNHDKEIIYDYGVRLIIDLRSEYEIKRAVCTMTDYKDVEYVNIQLLDNIMSSQDKKSMPSSLVEMYCGFLEKSKASFLEIFKKILTYPDNCVLFNCTAGKDRTGVVAMLLLKLAGVPEEVIVTDYAASYQNVKKEMDRNMFMMKLMRINIPLCLLFSESENMITTLSYFKENYGTIENYLSDIGLTENEIDALRNKLLGK